MDKKALKFDENRVESFLYGENSIQVKNYLSLAEMGVLVMQYLNELFDPEEEKNLNYKYMNAEYTLYLNVIDLCTSIKLFEDDGITPLFTIDTFISNPILWKEIKSRIKNYDDFYDKLQSIVEERKEQRRLDVSIGKIINNGYTKLMEFLSGLNGEAMSDESIEKVKGLLKEINESPVLKESIKIFKNQSEIEISPAPKKRVSKK